MTKKELLKWLQGLSDDAVIYIETEDSILHIVGFNDRVADENLQNEITLICR